MQINWWTLALQAVNFLVLVWLLQRFLYRPVREVIEKRRQLAERAFAEAAEKQQEADAAKTQYENDREALVAERHDMLKKVHEEQEAEHGKIVEAAHKEADGLIESARAAIARERESALADLREETAGLAAEMAADLLRRTGANASGDIFLEQLEARLAALPADERVGLNKDIGADGAGLTVVTAVPLPEDGQARWRDRLGKALGHAGTIDFATDPDILGGAELHFPHAVLRFTWADQLRTAKEQMIRHDNAS